MTLDSASIVDLVKRLVEKEKSGDRGASKELNRLLLNYLVDLAAGNSTAEKIFSLYFSEKISWLIKLKLFFISENDKADLKQDILLAVISQIKKGKFKSDKGDIGGYVYSIANNQVKNYLRKKNKLTSKNIRYNPSIHDISGEQQGNLPILTPQEITLLQKCNRELPEKYREIIRLVYYEGLKIGQVAKLLKINPVNKAYARKNLALKLLRECFSQKKF